MHTLIGCKWFIMFLTYVVFSATISERQLLKIAMFWFAGAWHKHFPSSLLSFISVFVLAQSHVSQNLLDLSDLKLNQWETPELCRVTSWKKSWARRCLQFSVGWCSTASWPDASAVSHHAPSLHHTGPVSFKHQELFSLSSTQAQCNLKSFVADNLHRMLCAFLSFPTVLRIYNNAAFQGQGYY